MNVEINSNVFSSLLLDLYDLRRALPASIRRLPKDNEGTELTIGDMLDDMIETMESYELTGETE